MRAIVTKAFPGVEDGKVYPRPIAVGETISGDLATQAIAGGFAEAVDEKKAAAARAKAEKAAAEKRFDVLKAIAEGAKVDISKAESAEDIEEALKAAGVEIPQG